MWQLIWFLIVSKITAIIWTRENSIWPYMWIINKSFGERPDWTLRKCNKKVNISAIKLLHNFLNAPDLVISSEEHSFTPFQFSLSETIQEETFVFPYDWRASGPSYFICHLHNIGKKNKTRFRTILYRTFRNWLQRNHIAANSPETCYFKNVIVIGLDIYSVL